MFFVLIVLLVATKWSYTYVSNLGSLEIASLNMQNNNSAFDSVKAFELYKNQVIQNIDENILNINNLKLAIDMENKIVKEKLEKQLEEIVFKNNQLSKMINNYSLQSVSKFQFFKINFNKLLAENNKLITEIFEKHQTILNHQ